MFFFKQKTAYEMRISDWSSDGCSSDLSIADPAVVLREHGLLADLSIMSLPRESEVAQADPVDLATATGTPILRLGAATSREAFRRVLIGWKEDRKSTRLNSSH